MKRIFGIVASAALLSACATTPAPAPAYEAAPGLDASGWLTAPADGGRYVVAYTGTKGMSRDQVARYALLRAAEFTAEAGQEWFAVISTKSNNVQVASKEDLKARSGGGFLGGAGGSSTGAGGAGNTANPQGTADATTSGGASTGGFGGGAPPTQVLERWQPPTVPQTVIIIQMGRGEQAKFAGLDKAPEIFSAKTTAEDIRAKMKQ